MATPVERLDLPLALVEALYSSPVAYWYLSRPSGRMQWSNRLAQQLAAPGLEADSTMDGSAAVLGWEAWLGLCSESMSCEAPAELSRSWPRLVQGQPQLWLLMAQVTPDAVLLMAVQAQAAASYTLAASAAHPPQRDLLVREVHHRLKNNLQGVSGLLQQQAVLHPEAARWLEAASSQLQAMAQVYGLQTQGEAPPTLLALVRSVAQGVASVFGVVIDVLGPAIGEAAGRAPSQAAPTQEPDAMALRQTLWAHLESPPAAAGAHHVIHADQVGALALVINELLTNAVKHRNLNAQTGGLMQGVAVRCEVKLESAHAVLEIVNVGEWPSAPSWHQVKPGVHGLGLTRALLPSRGARLSFHTEPGLVCARLQIGPPVWCAGVIST